MALNNMQKHVGPYNYVVKSIYVHVMEALLDCLLNYLNVYESVWTRVV